jgi:hypothetical protein
MSLSSPVKEFLSYLQKNPATRAAIAAPPNQTVLYAGNFFRPIWRELLELKRSRPEFSSKRMLSEVLVQITVPGSRYSNLLAWAEALDRLVPWKENGFIVWRALSGIYASNATGAVSFCVGSGVTKANTVFAATELPVLLRNRNVDPITMDILRYYQRCIQQGQSAVNFGYTAAR